MSIINYEDKQKTFHLDEISISSDHARVLLVWLALALVCKSGAITGGYAVDDYLVSTSKDVANLVLSQGRYFLAALLYLVQQSSLNIVDLGPVACAIVICINVVMVGAILRFLSYDIPHKYMLGAGALMLTHPYTAEIFTFRMGMLAYGVALLSVAASLELLRNSRGFYATIAAICSITFGLLTYQIVLNYLTTVAFFSAVITLLLQLSGKHLSHLQQHRVRTVTLFYSIVAALIIYCTATFCLNQLFHVQSIDRATLISLNEVSERFHVFMQSIYNIYWGSEPIAPRWLKTLQLFLLITSCGMLVRVKEWLPVTGLRFFQLGGLLVACVSLLPLSVGVILFFKSWWPVPRAISHVSLIVGALYFTRVYADYIRNQSSNWLRLLLRAALGLIVAGSIGMHTNIFADQHRVNAWDRALGNRIVARLEGLANFQDADVAHVVGGSVLFPLGLRTVCGDLNISAWGPSWANPYVLNAISGYRWRGANAEEQQQANAYCQTADKWPAAASVTIEGHVAIICLAPTW